MKLKYYSLLAVCLVSFMGCSKQEPKSALPSEALEEKRVKAARNYKVNSIKAENLVELYKVSSAEFMRLINFIEEQELFKGLNPQLGKAKRKLDRVKPAEGSGAKEFSDATGELVRLSKELSQEPSFRSEYRRKFGRLEDRIDDEHRRLKREFGIY